MEQHFRSQLTAILANKKTPNILKIHFLDGLRASLLHHLQNQRVVVQKQKNYMEILSEFNHLYKNLNAATYESYIKNKKSYLEASHEFDENKSESKRKECLLKMQMVNEELRKQLKNLIEKKRELKGLSMTIDDTLKCKKAKFLIRLETIEKMIRNSKVHTEKSKLHKGKTLEKLSQNANKQNQIISNTVTNALTLDNRYK